MGGRVSGVGCRVSGGGGERRAVESRLSHVGYRDVERSALMGLESYRDLRVWQLSMQLAEDCYRLTRSFPREETFGLTSQIRRASSRIPANIAEGYGRSHRGEYLQFLRVAQGSLKELE